MEHCTIVRNGTKRPNQPNLPLGHKENSLEFELTFNREVLDGKVLLPVVCQALVEAGVFLGSDVLGIPRPDRLGLVEFFVFLLLLLDLLGLLSLALGVLVFVLDLFDLGLFTVLILLHLLLVVLNFNIDLLGDDELDGVGDELGVLLDNLLDLLLLEIIELILLEEHPDLGTASKGRIDGIGSDGEGTTSGRFPDVLFVVIVLGDDLDAFRDEIGRVETDTELANHRNVGARAERFHERLCARLGDGSQVVDEVGFGHADTSITEGEYFVLLVGGDTDKELGLRLECLRIGQRGITNLIESI